MTHINWRTITSYELFLFAKYGKTARIRSSARAEQERRVRRMESN